MTLESFELALISFLHGDVLLNAKVLRRILLRIIAVVVNVRLQDLVDVHVLTDERELPTGHTARIVALHQQFLEHLLEFFMVVFQQEVVAHAPAIDAYEQLQNLGQAAYFLVFGEEVQNVVPSFESSREYVDIQERNGSCEHFVVNMLPLVQGVQGELQHGQLLVEASSDRLH